MGERYRAYCLKARARQRCAGARARLAIALQVLALCTGSLLSTAWARERAPLRASLTFSSPAGCGDGADFAERVEQRATHVRFVAANVRERVSVRIEPQGDALVAHVSLRSGTRRLAERRIEAEVCEDALDAAALIVAVTLEGHAQRRKQRRRPRAAPPAATTVEPASTEPSEPAPTGPAPTEQEPTATEPAESPELPEPEGGAAKVAAAEVAAAEVTPAELGERSPEPATTPVADAPPPTPARERAGAWRARVGAGGALGFGLAPGALPGWVAYASIEHALAPPWAPRLELGVAVLGRDGFEGDGGRAAFDSTAASLAFCPLALRVGVVELWPCVVGSYGRLVARGYDTFEPERHERSIAAAGARLALELGLGPLELGARLDLTSPFVRRTFRFDPGAPLFETPRVNSGLALTAGLRFP